MADEDWEEDYDEDEDGMGTGNKVGIAVKDTADGVEKLTEFGTNPNGNAFALLMEHEGKLLYYHRGSQPCYGEMRTYGDKSTQPEVHKPGDLFHPFPDGTPVGVSVPFFAHPQNKNRDVLASFLFGKDSPWRRGTGTFDVLRVDGVPKGIITMDTEFDPTPLISALICSRSLLAEHYCNILSKLRVAFPKREDFEHFRVMCFFQFTGSQGWAPMSPLVYSLSSQLVLKRFNSGDSVDITGGTFRDRYAYNRPKLEKVFSEDGKNDNPLLDTINELKKGDTASNTYRPQPMDKLDIAYNVLDK